MPHYTSGSEVYELLIDLGIGLPTRFTTAQVDTILDGIEARVDSILRAQGYPEVPIDSTSYPEAFNHIAQQVRRRAAVLVWQLTHATVTRSPDWVRAWDIDFNEWLTSLRQGEMQLVPELPADAQDGEIVFSTFRILPSPEDE